MRGRNLKPSRVYQTASAILASNSTHYQAPAWFKVIGAIPPGEILTRSQPPQHREICLGKKIRKPSKSFKPQQIVYEEDELRSQFYKDHPWELARPRILLENDGRDGQGCNWSRISQPGRALTGESVVQRQLWLMHQGQRQKDEAYDIARKEFYALRHEEEVERRVAKEEALWTGAYFGKGALQVGMELEDKTYNEWLVYAKEAVSAQALSREAAYTSIPDPDELDSSLAEDLGGEELVVGAP